MGEGMLFFTFLLIGEQISASIFGRFRKKSYLCTAIRKKWRFRLGVRTHASHAWNTGSIPVVATKEREKQHRFSLFFCLDLEGVQSSDDRVPLVAHPLTAQITRRVCQNSHPVKFTDKVPTFTSVAMSKIFRNFRH